MVWKLVLSYNDDEFDTIIYNSGGFTLFSGETSLKKSTTILLKIDNNLDGLLVLYIVSPSKIEEKKCLQTLTAVRQSGKIEVYQKRSVFWRF